MGEKQSLQDILEARDKRVEYQGYLLNKYRGAVISYKLNIPGPVKYSPLIKKIFDEGLDSLHKKLDANSIQLIFEKAVYKNSGPEYFGVFDLDPRQLKKLIANLEEEQPLGRLWDFDVLDDKGVQISREEIGIEPRKCLLCEENAFECGRSRRHDVDALISKIEKMAIEFFGSNFNI
jgi:holo-ACP synthase